MLADWVEWHTSEAPEALRTRVQQHVAGADARRTVPEALAHAAQAALGRVLTHPGDRSVALDLLAADALITLALLAQAERAPDRLAEFAASILQSVRPDA
ncbi:MAG: hypothetical protein ACJ8DC_12070 [Gemmatimonadales bacterium]